MRDRSGSTAPGALVGALAGVVATTAMTLAADALFTRLPGPERYPLPPRELTERAAAAVGLRGRANEPGMVAATLASHFAFGAAAGSLYTLLFQGRRLSPLVAGVGYSLAIWTVSYLGWVPALGLLRPATEHPARRNALMIAVHVVWGSTLGLVADRLSRASVPISGGPLRDR